MFSDIHALDAWLVEHRDNHILEEGVELHFARLVPTFCDRLSYYVAILPRRFDGPHSNPSSLWHRPLKAKLFFDGQLQARSRPQLDKLVKAVLDNFHMLYFPITINEGRRDGTEDLMVVYERLALRDATFCKPHRDQEYVSMDGSDMIRNLLLGSFTTENEALGFYKEYWLPLERLVSEEESGDMKETLEAFLAEEEFNAGRATYIGGQIYADFESWLSRDQDSTTDPEAYTRKVGERLLKFAEARRRA